MRPKRRLLALSAAAAAFAYWRSVYRFRDPVRFGAGSTAQPGTVLSPADGTVSFVRRIDLGRLPNDSQALAELLNAPVLPQDGWLVGIVISPLDVHYTYQPTGGTVVMTRHRKGAHQAVALPQMLNMALGQAVDLLNEAATRHNERYTYILHSDLGGAVGDITVTQVGLRHRLQAVTYLREGMAARAGNKATFLPEGGLVLVHLPAHLTPQVRVGQRVRGAETVLARA